MTVLSEKPMAETLPRQSGAGSLLDGHYAPPPKDEGGQTWIRTSVVIQSTPQRLYEMWRNVEEAPAWHERVVNVRRLEGDVYRWTMRDEPGDDLLEWDYQILADEPGKRIAWKSVSGDPESAGEVIFEPASGDRGTLVTRLEQFRMGKASRAWETMTGRDPKQSVIENLRHFKAFAETGETPKTEPQPHGDRGAGARVKRSIYGENIANPPGGSLEGSTQQKGEKPL
jgi:uncharacterized membrane protein